MLCRNSVEINQIIGYGVAKHNMQNMQNMQNMTCFSWALVHLQHRNKRTLVLLHPCVGLCMNFNMLLKYAKYAIKYAKYAKQYTQYAI
jgi:hypothetical protein